MAIQSKVLVKAFDSSSLEALARELAETVGGLTGSELTRTLAEARIPDVDPQNTKWKRLFNAFVDFENEHGVGNHVVVFIKRAMAPARYTTTPAVFERRRHGLNRILAMEGMTLGEDGKVRKAGRATTLAEAVARANEFQARLEQRDVHPDVVRACTPEVLSKNYFHAVLESLKSVTHKIRALSGLDRDGAPLVDAAFGGAKKGLAVLAINALATDTQMGEHQGFMSLLKGLYGLIRNPLAHEPKTDWPMTEQDALDVMATVSLVHRKLDTARRLRSLETA